MYCILLDSSKLHHIKFLKFLLENKPNSFEVIEYSDLSKIDWKDLEKYDYTLLLSRYCYINFAKLLSFLNSKNPSFASLSTYWGVGFPYLAILNKDVVASIDKQKSVYNTYFDDPLENLFINIILQILGISNIQELLSKPDKELNELFSLHRVVKLDKWCYLNNIEYVKGNFHDSIFVGFSDTDDGLISFLTEYHSGKKYIKYKQQSYRLIIGKEFFIVKDYHVGLISNDTMVIWDRQLSQWKKAGPKISQKILDYIKKNFVPAIDTDTPT